MRTHAFAIPVLALLTGACTAFGGVAVSDRGRTYEAPLDQVIEAAETYLHGKGYELVYRGLSAGSEPVGAIQTGFRQTPDGRRTSIGATIRAEGVRGARVTLTVSVKDQHDGGRWEFVRMEDYRLRALYSEVLEGIGAQLR